MSMTSHTLATISESLCVLIQEAHDCSLPRALRDGSLIAVFSRMCRLLEALPLASAEFSVALNRLANAQRYLRDGECGAARYELRLLQRSLRK
jgi:hypothetical protein